MSLTDIVPSLDEFTQFSDEQVAEFVYPHQLGVSLLINGTRRWYVSEYLDTPPTDDSYLMHYLHVVLERLAELFTLLASHGIYRVFIPVYSEDQKQRHATAHQYLMQGIAGLSSHPDLIATYHQMGYDVRFYGDMAHHFRGGPSLPWRYGRSHERCGSAPRSAPALPLLWGQQREPPQSPV